MRRIGQLIEKHLDTGLIPSRQIANIVIMMEEYANEVVDECHNKFIWEYDCEDEHDAVIITDPDSIAEVRKQIKRVRIINNAR